MAITEQDRRNIFNRLEDLIGTTEANNLMELLPTTPSDHLVTRQDMHANTTMLRGEMAELRGEMAELRSEVRSDIARLDGTIVALGADIRNEISQLRDHTTRILAGAIAANAIALIGVLVA